MFTMKDSGQRENFRTGAVRDIRRGKGRYDLVSPFAMKRLAIVYEKGSEKYSDRNWEKGMPHTRYFDSAIRHLNQWLQGDSDEDHLAHAAWNVFAIMHMQKTDPGLDDRPEWTKKVAECGVTGCSCHPKSAPLPESYDLFIDKYLEECDKAECNCHRNVQTGPSEYEPCDKD